MTNLPELCSLTPAKAKRAWLKSLADRAEPTGQSIIYARYVGMALYEYGREFGKAGEDIARKNLADRLATFQASYARTAD